MVASRNVGLSAAISATRATPKKGGLWRSLRTAEASTRLAVCVDVGAVGVDLTVWARDEVEDLTRHLRVCEP